jgi:tRNA threonylcarbamoyladenosine biosynthesis protein TsaB
VKLLAIDTATLTASVAVLVDGEVAAAEATGPGAAAPGALRRADAPGHAEELMPLIARVIAAAALAPSALAAVAVGAGPGSFTGLRIGMATAKGIALAADRPLWAVSSLAALALAAAGDAPAGAALLVPVLDARRGELYAGFYEACAGGVTAVAAERVLPPGELAAAIAAARGDRPGAIVLGDALAAYAAALGELGDGVTRRAAPTTPHAIEVARLALAGQRADVLTGGVPVYLRPAEAEVKYPDGVPGALRRRT